MDKHPIIPPLYLAQQWLLEAHHEEAPPGTCPDTRILIARAAQWGADQELEACCEWLGSGGYAGTCFALRAARRPKPPSLKEQALAALLHLDQGQHNERCLIIRRALEQLDD
jgi:hypothetical protein